MADKLTEVIRDIVTLFNADATMNSLGWTDGSIYWNGAYEGAPFPYIILDKQTEVTDHRLGGMAFTRHWVAFRAVDTGSTTGANDGGARARAIGERVKDLLENFRPSIPVNYVMDIRASTGFDYAEKEVGNIMYFHSAKVFVIMIAE